MDNATLYEMHEPQPQPQPTNKTATPKRKRASPLTHSLMHRLTPPSARNRSPDALPNKLLPPTKVPSPPSSLPTRVLIARQKSLRKGQPTQFREIRGQPSRRA